MITTTLILFKEPWKLRLKQRLPLNMLLHHHMPKRISTRQVVLYIGDLNTGVTTKKKNIIDCAKLIANIFYTSSFEPILVSEALKDEL